MMLAKLRMWIRENIDILIIVGLIMLLLRR